MASWYDMAVAVVGETRRLGFSVKVKSIFPVTTEEFPLAAKSPHFSVLSKRKIRPLLSVPIRNWRESLVKMLKEFKE
ncbi:sugar nucleotide-binding protein [Nitrospira sp. T9]|uniref:sugar nucleotide-binding protein n=1 Tax=unclassified Nitrospira TaxID=2652172 RepID=UPI003F99DE23